MRNPGKQVNVAILIFPNVEVTDMAGPMDVFTKANYYASKVEAVTRTLQCDTAAYNPAARYRVYTVAENNEPVCGESSVLKIMPEFTIHNCPVPDIIVIPGIRKADDQEVLTASKPVVNWIRRHKDKFILSVCIGAFTLAKTGLLAGKNATTHYAAIPDLAAYPCKPLINVVRNVKYVHDDENIVTAGGISCGIAGAIYVVELFDGTIVAGQVADVLVYSRDAPLPLNTIVDKSGATITS